MTHIQSFEQPGIPNDIWKLVVSYCDASMDRSLILAVGSTRNANIRNVERESLVEFDNTLDSEIQFWNYLEKVVRTDYVQKWNLFLQHFLKLSMVKQQTCPLFEMLVKVSLDHEMKIESARVGSLYVKRGGQLLTEIWTESKHRPYTIHAFEMEPDTQPTNPFTTLHKIFRNNYPALHSIL
jgi:hypothetical protein